MTDLLDTEFIRARRLALGLSQRALARAMRVTSPTVARLEDARNHEALTLSMVIDLADALAVSPATLLRRSTEPTDTQTDSAGNDDTQVEAVLVEAGRLVAMTHIARALGWDLTRTRRALRGLRERLAGGGQRVHTGPNATYGLRAAPDALTPAQRQTIARADMATRSMDRTMARLLRTAVAGRLDSEPATNAERVALGTLINAGLVERADGFVPTAAVLDALSPIRPAAGGE